MRFHNETKKNLIDLSSEKNIFLEGSILKVVECDENKEFDNYIKKCIERDKDLREKRLEVTKKIQQQNIELIQWKEKNEQINLKLNDALEQANKARQIVERDLELLQKKTQFELIGQIVKVSLAIIIMVGLITTGLYWTTIIKGTENQIIESTWANMFSILLTNSFSIVGTIMGIKWSTETKK